MFKNKLIYFGIKSNKCIKLNLIEMQYVKQSYIVERNSRMFLIKNVRLFIRNVSEK